jgi:hypothetical protein
MASLLYKPGSMTFPLAPNVWMQQNICYELSEIFPPSVFSETKFSCLRNLLPRCLKAKLELVGVDALH